MKIPKDWTFEHADVAGAFDAHVREQLPWYDLATDAAAHIARHFISEGGLVYDIGASTGNIERALTDTLNSRRARFVPIEKSAEMAKKYDGGSAVEVCDALEYEFEPYDVAICFLTIMFMPPSRRLPWLRELAAKQKPGGALIVFDKITFCDGYIATIAHRLTLRGKADGGASPSDIMQKEISLCGAQRPLDARLLEMTLPTAQRVFQYGEFAGWVIQRPE